MTEPHLVSMAQQFTGLHVQHLIGAPLTAAAEANAAMAMTQVKFLLDTAFYKDKETEETYQPIMIQMKLTQSVITPGVIQGNTPPDPTIKTAVTTFELPLLTILPLNSLGVVDATVSFNMEVKSSYAKATNSSTDKQLAGGGTFTAKIGFGPFSATVSGHASYSNDDKSAQSSHYHKSNSASYTITAKASQLPLPEGVKTIIDAFTKSISPIKMPAPTTPGDGDGDGKGKGDGDGKGDGPKK